MTFQIGSTENSKRIVFEILNYEINFIKYIWKKYEIIFSIPFLFKKYS